MQKLLCNVTFVSSKINKILKLFCQYLLIFSIFTLMPSIAYAECSYEREAELSRIAANVGFSYNYEMVSGYPEFTVNITNISDDIYVIDSQGNIFSHNKEFNPKYSHGKKITYDIYSNDNNCKSEKILTTYVSLPFFNQYSMLSECKEYAEFNLCSLWYNTASYTEEEFYDELEKYKVSSSHKEESEEKTLFERIKEVFMEKTNFVYLILSIVGIVMLIGIYVVRKVRK